MWRARENASSGVFQTVRGFTLALPSGLDPPDASALRDQQYERLRQASLDRRAGWQPNFLASRRQHQGRSRASTDGGTGCRTSFASEQPADESASTRTDPDLLSILGPGAIGCIRHRVRTDLIAVAVDVELVEAERQLRAAPIESDALDGSPTMHALGCDDGFVAPTQLVAASLTPQGARATRC